MSTLTTNDIKNVGQLQEKNEFASNDALLAWDAAGQKHVKLTYQKLNQAYSTIQSACETAQGAAEDAAAEAAGFAKGTGGGTYTNNNAEYFKTQAAAEALKSEGWAEGTENGTDVPSTSPYHEHNSKYWATQAGTSAGSAGTDALKAEGFAVGQQNGTDVPSTSPYYENNAAYYADQASDSADAAAGSASEAEDWAEIARDAAAGALGNFFGTCSTLAGTAAKDVAISEFSLYTGVKVQVKFTNGHTLTATKDANGVVTADYPTLNVSSTGAKAIKVGAEYAGENFVTAGDTHEFIYDGTYWVDLTAVNIYENSTTARKRDGQIVDTTTIFAKDGINVSAGLSSLRRNVAKYNEVVKLELFVYSGGNPMTNGSVIGKINDSKFWPRREIFLVGWCAGRYSSQYGCDIKLSTDGTLTLYTNNSSGQGEVSCSATYLLSQPNA